MCVFGTCDVSECGGVTQVERLREEGYQLARQQEELLRQELLTKAEGE